MSSLDYLDLCRLCLVKDRVSVPIFDGEGDVRQIFLKIAACLPVKVAREDKLPKKICDDCVYKVELFYQFWNTTANAEKQLLQWLGNVGLEEKQGYVSGVLNSDIMKQEQSDNRLDVPVMQSTSEHSSNMAMNMMDGMNLGIPIIISTDQQIAVPISSSNNTVQTVQSVPGPSTRSAHNQMTRKDGTNEVEDDTSEDDNTDDDCDGDEGLPVKEESEDTASGNRVLEPSTYVNVAMACDEAGPSGLQQQKLAEMPEMGLQQASEADPKSGYNKSTEMKIEDTRGLFFYEQESVTMRKWQILEFDGKPYYAFVPVNETPIDTENIPLAETIEDLELVHDNVKNCKLKGAHEDEHNDELMGNDASFYDHEYKENENLDEEIENNGIKPIIMNGVINENSTNTQGDLYEVKVEGSVVTIEKLQENIINVRKNNENTSTIDAGEDQEYEELGEDDGENQQQLEDDNQDVEETEEALENDMIDEEDQQTHEVPEFIDGDSMESQIIEYLSGGEEEEEEDVDDVKAVEEESSESPLPDQSENQRQTRYRPILPNTSVALKCKACSETFGSAIAFRKHVAWTHKKKVYIQEDGAYICAVCDYRTLKKSLFAAHLERKHETWPRKDHNSLVFPCAVCGFVCRSKHSLQSHFIRKHTDKYEHQCKFCPKKFKVKGDLTNHVRFHHKEKPINCDVCGKLCPNTGSLYVHQKWAHYKPNYECTICKRRMVSQENLAQHMVTQHEKREKIVCAECGKTFTKKDSFKRHMAVHTGSKPHPCPVCHKPFARQSQLWQHVLIHMKTRPFVCDICGKAFTQKPGLICHRKTHPGPLPPLPVMPIADLVKEFTAEYLQENANVIDEVEHRSE